MLSLKLEKRVSVEISHVAAVQVGHMLQGQIHQAFRVEHTTWNGMMAHIGYYQNGMTVVTIQGGQQYVLQNGVTIAWSNSWRWETINGVTYSKHFYPDGCIYSDEWAQFMEIF